MTIKKEKTLKISRIVSNNAMYQVKVILKNKKLLKGWNSNCIYLEDADLTLSNMDQMLRELNTFVQKWCDSDVNDDDFNYIKKSDFNFKIKESFELCLKKYVGEIKIPKTDIVLGKKYQTGTYPIWVDGDQPLPKWKPKTLILICHKTSPNIVDHLTEVEEDYNKFKINLNLNLLKLFYLRNFERNMITNENKFLLKGYRYLNDFILDTHLLRADDTFTFNENNKYNLDYFLKCMALDETDILINGGNIDLFFEITEKIIFLFLGDLFQNIKKWLKLKIQSHIKDLLDINEFDFFIIELRAFHKLLQQNKEYLVNKDDEMKKYFESFIKIDEEIHKIPKKYQNKNQLGEFRKIENFTGELKLGIFDKIIKEYQKFFKYVDECCVSEDINREDLEHLFQFLKEFISFSENPQYNPFLINLFKKLSVYVKDRPKIENDQKLFQELNTDEKLSISLFADFKTIFEEMIQSINMENKKYCNIIWKKTLNDNNERIELMLEDMQILFDLNSNLGLYSLFCIFYYYFEINFEDDEENIVRYFKITRLLFIINLIKEDLKKKYDQRFLSLFKKSQEIIVKFKNDLKFLNISPQNLIQKKE